jgi:hypothetical protein
MKSIKATGFDGLLAGILEMFYIIREEIHIIVNVFNEESSLNSGNAC